MTLDELLLSLRHNNVNLWVEKDRLRYKAPHEVMTPKLLAQIRKHKKEIIAFLGEADTYKESSLPEIRDGLRPAGNLPLSFAQEPLWFLHQLKPGHNSDHLSAGFRLIGQLNVTALEKSLNEIVRRHEILRTTFPSVDGQPIQMINPEFTLRITEVDLQGFSSGQ